MPTILRSTGTGPKRRRSRGQVVVIFAGAAILFMLLCAAVVDISWYWTNNLRMQRAADASALAGVVYLPGNVNNDAYTAAFAEAKKNGYENGVNGFTVTALKDTQDDRRLVVTIHGSIGTFFARVVGINSWPAERVARADFVLPVPMGSPLNYYGVSKLYGTTTSTVVNPNLANKNSGLTVATTALGGTTPWVSSPVNNLPAAVNASDVKFVSTTSNSAVEVFGGFGITSGLLAGESIVPGQVTGLQVVLTKASVSATCANTRIAIALSWDGGTSWTSVTAQTALLTTTASTITFGAVASTAFWTTHTTWTQAELGNTNFKVRLTSIKGACGGGPLVKLDMIQVQANYQTTTPTSTTTIADDLTARPVADPAGGAAPPLASQGFWGAIITRGGDRGNGDRYSTTKNGAGSNLEYDGLGHDYTIEVGAGGQVQIFDPTFCATGNNLSQGSYGTGDHYIATPVAPVTTVFTLLDTRGTPYNLKDDVWKADSGTLFKNEQQADLSGTYGNTLVGGNATTVNVDCASTPGGAFHNKWWTLATGLALGTYRLNVSTADAGNISTNAENMWSVWTSGGAAPRVYGGGRMVAYTNLPAGKPTFYLAQIPKEHAGKTMIIGLFDPGDVGGNAFLRIKSPDKNAYNDATFSYTATDLTSPTNLTSENNITQVQVASGGTNLFQNEILTISINLPSNYGSIGLTPPGEPGAGWWKIEYEVAGGNDTTTWNVSIRGNPVHLILP